MSSLADAQGLIERASWDYFWVPEGVMVHDRPELLYLSSQNDRAELNVVMRTAVERVDLHAAVVEVGAAHHAVRSRWHVPARVGAERLVEVLRDHGYEWSGEFDVRAIETAGYVSRPATGARVVRVSNLQGLRDFIAVSNAAFSRPRPRTDAQLEAELAQCAPEGGRVHRFVAYVDDEPVSCGGLNTFDSLGLAFLWAGCTLAEARGRGLYSAIVSARIRWARKRGLQLVGLYALTSSSSPIVAKQGFSRHGSMTYWERAPLPGALP